MPHNGKRIINSETPPPIKVRSVQVALMVDCPCGSALLLAYITGMNLTTTCKCGKRLTLGGLMLEGGHIQTAIHIAEAEIIKPTPLETMKLAGG